MKILTLILGILAAGSALAADGQKSAYPLTVCVVSGEPLDSMGGPYVMTHAGQEVRLCCEHCKPKFDKDPAAYLKKIQDAKK
jgi:YHS domain-containing protein